MPSLLLEVYLCLCTYCMGRHRRMDRWFPPKPSPQSAIELGFQKTPTPTREQAREYSKQCSYQLPVGEIMRCNEAESG